MRTRRYIWIALTHLTMRTRPFCWCSASPRFTKFGQSHPWWISWASTGLMLLTPILDIKQDKSSLETSILAPFTQRTYGVLPFKSNGCGTLFTSIRTGPGPRLSSTFVVDVWERHPPARKSIGRNINFIWLLYFCPRVYFVCSWLVGSKGRSAGCGLFAKSRSKSAPK